MAPSCFFCREEAAARCEKCMIYMCKLHNEQHIMEVGNRVGNIGLRDPGSTEKESGIVLKKGMGL